MYSDIANNAYKYNVQVEALYNFSGNTPWYPCVIYDINEWGATLKIMQSLVKGDRIFLKLHLDDEEMVITGEVNQSADPKYVVNFQKATGDTRSFISRLISRVFNEKKNEINNYKRKYG